MRAPPMRSAWTAARTTLLPQAVCNGFLPAGRPALLAPGVKPIVGVIDVVWIFRLDVPSWNLWILMYGFNLAYGAGLPCRGGARRGISNA